MAAASGRPTVWNVYVGRVLAPAVNDVERSALASVGAVAHNGPQPNRFPKCHLKTPVILSGASAESKNPLLTPMRQKRGRVTFLSPNKKVTKEVGYEGAELIAPAIKAAPSSSPPAFMFVQRKFPVAGVRWQREDHPDRKEMETEGLPWRQQAAALRGWLAVRWGCRAGACPRR